MKRVACTAVAGTNIALVKYWGKRDAALNLPAAGSLSLTLNELGTRTTVRFGSGTASGGGAGAGIATAGSVPYDRIRFNGRDPDAATRARIVAFLDLVRDRAGIDARADVVTENSVPTASGLASSASGFAALALAASTAAGLALDPTELSVLARRGSGSAARSIFGGLVEMRAGVLADGSDAAAVAIAGSDGWPLRMVVAVTALGEKSIGSTAAMERTARTSPFYGAWIASVERDLQDARAAIAERDLARLGAVAERSAMRMHATALAADPPILYWTAATFAVLATVRQLRARGIGAFATIDAGPHVKILCATDDAHNIAAAVTATPGVLRTLIASPGPGAHIVHDTETSL